MRTLAWIAALAVAVWLVGCGGGATLSPGGAVDQSAFGRMDNSTTTSSTDGALTGVTTDATGRPVGNCTVTVTGVGRATTASFSTLSDAAGQFQIGNMQAGQYLLGASHESYGESETEVKVRPGLVTDCGQRPLRPSGGLGGQPGEGSFNQAGEGLADAGSIVGKVVDPDGNPIAKARLRIGERLHAGTGELGAFAFPPLPEGAYTVECAARGYLSVSQEAQVAPGEATQLLFTLTAGDSEEEPRVATGTVTGTVTDAETDDPVVGATVQLRGGRAEQTTGEDGSFAFEAVPAGGLWLLVRADGYLPLRLPLRLPPGAEIDVPVALVVAPDPSTVVTGTLLVTVLADEAGEPIAGARVAIDGRGPIATDETGQVEVTDVPVGRHLVVAGARGYQPKREVVRVTADETVALELRLSADNGNWSGPPQAGPGGERPPGQGG